MTTKIEDGALKYSIILLILMVSLIVACSEQVEPQAAKKSEYLFEDDFSVGSVGQWNLEGDELGSTEVSSEQLVIDVIAPNTVQFSTLEEPAFTDFDLEVSGLLLDGSQDSTYGILFRMLSPNEFYRFEIMGDGHYMIERLNDDGSWTRFVDDWQNSEAILAGVNAKNQIRVVADGPFMAFYVNGELLHEVEDYAYISGNIGLDAGTYGHPKTRVAFDDIKISLP